MAEKSQDAGEKADPPGQNVLFVCGISLGRAQGLRLAPIRWGLMGNPHVGTKLPLELCQGGMSIKVTQAFSF